MAIVAVKDRPKRKDISDVLDMDLRKEILKIDTGFTIAGLFRPLISKLVTYNNKTIFSCPIETFNRKFKLKPDAAILGLLDEIYELGFSPVLAGGKLISYINGDTLVKNDNDYDLYCTSDKDLYALREVIAKDDRFESLAELPYLNEYL